MKYEEVEVNSERWFDLTPLLNEEFRDITDYEGLYQVSNYGRIKSLKRRLIQYNGYGDYIHNYKERILALTKHRQGYLMVNLSKNCKQKLYQVHRLVAKTFLPNPNYFKEVNHKNAIKYDNKLSNLEWCDRLYNQREAERLGLVKSPMRIVGIGNPSNKTVICINENGEIIKEYPSITLAAKDIGVPMKHLSYCLISEKKDKALKYYWKYKEMI